MARRSLAFVWIILVSCLALAAPLDVGLEYPTREQGLPGAGPLRPEKWFGDIWRARRESFAATAPAERGSLVFIGDSIVQGWDQALGPSFVGRPVCNRGIAADTSRGVLLRLTGDVLALEPRGVVLLIGTNDIEVQAEPAHTVTNIELILEELQRYQPTLPVFLCAVFPSSAQAHRPADHIRQINRGLREMVHRFPQVTFVDTWSLFADPGGDGRTAEFPDGLHPNERGYSLWGDLLRAALKRRGI